MRLDKLTTKFQEALSDAQTLALGADHAFIEPCHLLVAMLKQDDGPRSLLMRAGVNINGLLKDCEEAIKNLPQVHGQEQVQVSRDLVTLLQAAEKDALKRGDQSVAGELFILAFSESKSELANKARAHGLNKQSLHAAIEAVRGGESVKSADAEGHMQSKLGYDHSKNDQCGE